MKVLYTKFNRERLPEFQIMTQVFEEHGRIYARKKALNDKARDHIKKIEENTLHYNGKIIRSSVDEVVFDYNRNTPLTALLLNALKNGNDSGFRKIIGDYVRFIYRDTERDNIFIQTDEFVKVFGYLERPLKNINCFTKSNVDMSFDNLFANLNYKGNSPRFEPIDCEWVFDFKVPVEYVIFRAIICFSNEHRSHLHDYTLEKLFEISGIRPQNIKNYWSFEMNFSKYVFGENNIYINRQYNKEVKPFDRELSLKQWELKTYIPDDGYLESNTIIKMIDYGNEIKHHRLNIARPVKGKFRVDFGDTPAVAVIKSVTLSKHDGNGSVTYTREFSKATGFEGLALKSGLFEVDRNDDLIAVIYNADPYLIIDDEIENVGDERVSIEFDMYVNDRFDESVVMWYQKKIEHLTDTQRNEYSKALLELNEKLLSMTSQYYTINHEHNLANVKIAELEGVIREWTEKYYTLNHQNNLASFKIAELENEKLDMTNKYLTANHEKNLAENRVAELSSLLDNEVSIKNAKLAEAASVNENLRSVITMHENSANEMRNSISNLEQSNRILEQNNRTLEQNNRTLEQSKRTLEQSNQLLEQQLKEANDNINNLQESLRQIYNSGSWKITKPYRATKQFITGKK